MSGLPINRRIDKKIPNKLETQKIVSMSLLSISFLYIRALPSPKSVNTLKNPVNTNTMLNVPKSSGNNSLIKMIPTINTEACDRILPIIFHLIPDKVLFVCDL